MTVLFIICLVVGVTAFFGLYTLIAATSEKIERVVWPDDPKDEKLP